MSNDRYTASSLLAKDSQIETTASKDAQLPEHLAPLPGGQWAIWRWVGLRGAGFPLKWVFKLSSPKCASAADRYIAAQDLAEQAQEEALRALREIERPSDRKKDRVLQKAIQKLTKGRVPDPPTEQVQASIQAFGNAKIHTETAATNFSQAFQAVIVQSTQALCTVAQDDRFREALLWQNRHALYTGADALVREVTDARSRGSKQRQHEALVANYLQRYCTKNDTIGFFGPLGWARVVDHGAAVSARPGPTLLATRTVYFEGWCIDALADALAEDEALCPWFVPRRLPLVHVDGTNLHLPLAPVSRLSTAEAAILQACDGAHTAERIAQQLTRASANGIRSEEQVYKILRRMRSRRRIAWTLEVPVEGIFPERALQKLLEGIADERRREAALRALAALETARGAVADAAGDVGRLDQAMRDLESTFTRLTNTASTRRAGKMYAGRTLVYEDCRRDIEVTLGPELLASLGPPLTLLLASARWFTFQIAEIYRKSFKKIYAELVQKTGKRVINLASFWMFAHPLIFGDDTRPIDTVVRKLQERWSAILAVPTERRRVQYASEDLQQVVLTSFAAPQRGWKAARYHSPDVMIAAPSVEAIREGKVQFVMGELHPAANTMRAGWVVAQHPRPDDLLRATEWDLPGPQVMFVGTREVGGLTTRMGNALVSPKDWRFVFAHDSCGVPPSRALPVGSLVVQDADNTLVVRTRDGRLHFDIVEIFSDLLMVRVLHHFDIIPPSGHTPRINFDCLVVSRETWRFNPEDLRFAWSKSEAERFLNARRWVQTSDMPRFVFVKSTAETKPIYVDFASPVLVDTFAKVIRRAARDESTDAQITVTEMLPDPNQIWLTDHEGQRYTSELRIVALDLQEMAC